MPRRCRKPTGQGTQVHPSSQALSPLRDPLPLRNCSSELVCTMGEPSRPRCDPETPPGEAVGEPGQDWGPSPSGKGMEEWEGGL